MYYDKTQLIVSSNGDGGDTAGREGDYWFARALGVDVPERSLTFYNVMALLQARPGVFFRNPKQNPVVPPAKSWNDPTDFSRDQSIPIILSLGELEQYHVLKLMFQHICENFGRYPNGDFASPEDLNYFIRASKTWYLYPLLMLGDVQMVGESIIRCIQGRDPNDTSDDINHTLALLQAQHIYATPLSWIARKIYVLFRPQGGVQGAWDRYFNPESGANPFNDIYRELISGM